MVWVNGSLFSDFVPLFLFLFCFVLGLLGLSSFFVFWVSVVSSSEVRIACPSISFLFAHFEGSLGVFPYLENLSLRVVV